MFWFNYTRDSILRLSLSLSPTPFRFFFLLFFLVTTYQQITQQFLTFPSSCGGYHEKVIVGPMDKQDGLPWYFSLNNRRLWVLKRCREEGLLLGNDKNKIQVRVRQYKSATERNRYTLENCVLEATFLKESTLTTTTATTTITTHNQSPPPQSRNESQQEDEQQQQQGKCVGLSSSSSSSSTEGKGIKDMDNHTSLKSFMEESKLVERGNSCNLEDSQTTTLTTTTTMDGTTMETKSGQLVRIVEQPPLPEPDNLLLTAKDDVDDSSSSCSDSDSLFSGARRQNPFCVLD